MPSIKIRGKAQEAKSGFEPYDGPTPSRKGFYRGVIKKLQYRRNTKGSMGFYIVTELEAAAGDPKDQAIYDGYPMFISSIITESADGQPLKEGAQRNLDNFLFALGAGDDPNIITEDGDPEDGVVVKKIGNRNPVGAAVNIDIGFEDFNGEQRPKANGVYGIKDEKPGTAKSKAADIEEEDDSDLFEGNDEVEAEGDDEYTARSEELHGLGIPALKNILKSDYDLPISGTKDVLVERILEHEFAEEDEADEAEADEVEDDEVEDEVEDDEVEEDEAEDEDDEARAEREAELAGLDRTALKVILRAVSPEAQVLKRHTDDDIRGLILDAEFGEELPF